MFHFKLITLLVTLVVIVQSVSEEEAKLICKQLSSKITKTERENYQLYSKDFFEDLFDKHIGNEEKITFRHQWYDTKKKLIIISKSFETVYDKNLKKEDVLEIMPTYDMSDMEYVDVNSYETPWVTPDTITFEDYRDRTRNFFNMRTNSIKQTNIVYKKKCYVQPFSLLQLPIFIVRRIQKPLYSEMQRFTFTETITKMNEKYFETPSTSAILQSLLFSTEGSNKTLKVSLTITYWRTSLIEIKLETSAENDRSFLLCQFFDKMIDVNGLINSLVKYEKSGFSIAFNGTNKTCNNGSPWYHKFIAEFESREIFQRFDNNSDRVWILKSIMNE